MIARICFGEAIVVQETGREEGDQCFPSKKPSRRRVLRDRSRMLTCVLQTGGVSWEGFFFESCVFFFLGLFFFCFWVPLLPSEEKPPLPTSPKAEKKKKKKKKE